MPDNPNERGQNAPRVISEIVAFQYSDETGLSLLGEAELAIEILGDQADTGTNLYSVRVDIIAVFDPGDPVRAPVAFIAGIAGPGGAPIEFGRMRRLDRQG